MHVDYSDHFREYADHIEGQRLRDLGLPAQHPPQTVKEWKASRKQRRASEALARREAKRAQKAAA